MKDDLIDKVAKTVLDEQKHRDGIPQIAVGFYLMITMMISLQGQNHLAVIFVPLIPTLIEGLRKRITYPRIGYARVKEASSGKLVGLWVIFALILSGAAVFLMRMTTRGARSEIASQHFLAMWIVAVVIVLLALVIITRRQDKKLLWAIIPFIGVMAVIFASKWDTTAVYQFIIIFGAILMIVGIVRLRAFIRDFPVISDDK